MLHNLSSCCDFLGHLTFFFFHGSLKRKEKQACDFPKSSDFLYTEFLYTVFGEAQWPTAQHRRTNTLS